MKTFVTIVVVALAAGAWALTAEQQKKAKAYADECVKTTGVAPESVGKLKKGDFAGADDKTKCFSKCVLEKAGFMNAHGDIQEKVVIDKLSVDHDKSKVEATLKKCNQKGVNACDTAFKAYQCFYNTKAGLV
ncbi:general odorant-binding protein 56d-like [Topomyia yanbarensis]|uniref:general odorant-binding protein 56d-like n=1 Tax=Topomyia yanbarensis TaxID=2498891 RepID=UPI00273C9BFA|nr:general odorant-binding protein 56d-like [Topomyia yanbarensis]